MKRALALVLSVLLIMALGTACGVKEKIEQKAGEAVGEKLLEKAAGDDIDIDLDDDRIVIKGDDGETFEFGSGDWPDSELAGVIPRYDSGTITYVMEMPDAVQIVIAESDASYFDNYLKKIKTEFKNDMFESTSEDGITFTASDDSNHSIMIFYDTEECVISLNKDDS